MTGAAATVAAYCRAQGYPEPVAEYRFAPPRRWRFDLCWPDEMVAVEFQGGQWTGGRHVRGAGYTADCEKLTEAAVAGWRVLPVTHDHVKAGMVFGWLDRLFGEG